MSESVSAEPKSAQLKAFVVGDPIAHSRSPMIHGHWLKQHGVAGAYERVHAAPADFAAFFRDFPARGYRGGNVTLPHKEAAFALADVVTDWARRLGAVNTLWLEDGRVHGDNTDVSGFIANLDQELGSWRAQTALVLGAGGAARAVVAALLERGLESIVVANRTLAKAKDLAAFDAARIEPLEWPGADLPLAGTDLLINTTSLGMAGQPQLELALDALPDHAIVTDIVYVPLETRLLRDARARGLRSADGLGMLLHQATPGFARWFGVTPQVTPDLRRLVEADIGRRT